MKRGWCAGVMAAAVWTVGGEAAQQPGVSAHSAQQQAGTAAPAGSVTVTGCVERADQLMTGGANTLATSVDSLDFVLIRARRSGAEPSASVGTAGVAPDAAGAAAGPSGQIGPMFRLDGRTAMLNPHVGHEVEIVGTRSGSASSAPDARANAATPSLSTAPMLRVESVKMIADTCAR